MHLTMYEYGNLSTSLCCLITRATNCMTLLPVCSLWQRRVGELSLPPSSGEEAGLSSEWGNPEGREGGRRKKIMKLCCTYHIAATEVSLKHRVFRNQKMQFSLVFSL